MVSHGIEVPLQSNRTAITSDAVYGYVGMEKEPQPHNALTGAKMEAEAISRLIFGRGLLSEFKSRAIPARLMGVGAPAKQ
jgi:hypothetical protein